MPGTPAGGRKASETNKRKFGEDFYANIGAYGGKAKVPKGFALDRNLASRAGKIGGTMSRRGKKVAI